jgi:hypothetical protein
LHAVYYADSSSPHYGNNDQARAMSQRHCSAHRMLLPETSPLLPHRGLLHVTPTIRNDSPAARCMRQALGWARKYLASAPPQSRLTYTRTPHPNAHGCHNESLPYNSRQQPSKHARRLQQLPSSIHSPRPPPYMPIHYHQACLCMRHEPYRLHTTTHYASNCLPYQPPI